MQGLSAGMAADVDGGPRCRMCSRIRACSPKVGDWFARASRRDQLSPRGCIQGGRTAHPSAHRQPPTSAELRYSSDAVQGACGRQWAAARRGVRPAGLLVDGLASLPWQPGTCSRARVPGRRQCQLVLRSMLDPKPYMYATRARCGSGRSWLTGWLADPPRASLLSLLRARHALPWQSA